VLLGMGGDGHTASLFPHTAALHEEDRWVVDNDGPSVVPPPRVTMTYPLINGARSIAFFVLGAGKAEMIKRISTGSDGFETLPCKGIRPESGDLVWYLDRAACGG
jgi:6-phosphogluconolactonase/glucosamine-6-phosphate isomerase/deaminase